MRFLKQSTSVKVPVGPFVDVTDGATPETGITLGAADQAELMKQDASATVDISANTFAAITGNNGMYNLTLSTSDTDTLGMLHVHIGDVSVCRPVAHEFMVLPANIYNSFVLGTDYQQVDSVQVSGSTTAADNLEAGALGLVTGTVSTGSTTTVVTTGLTETTNDHYNGRTITFTSGALAGQSSAISDYSGSTKNLTVTALTEAPSNGDTFIIS